MSASLPVSAQRAPGSIREIVQVARRIVATVVGIGLIAIAPAAWAADGQVAVSAGCSFSSQAAAQQRFVDLGGAPGHDPGRFDADGDGVACEGLPGPYEGFATIGYNVKRGFFYGTAAMPADGSGGGFACLSGNRHFPEGPRQLKIYRARPGSDRAVSRTLGAEARPSSGRLLWKLEAPLAVHGRYYAAFEEEERLSPYKPTECPGFSSLETRLPAPKPKNLS
jgi:hypothetical protein